VHFVQVKCPCVTVARAAAAIAAWCTFSGVHPAIAVAAALSLLYIALGRRWVRSHLLHKTVASNADALVGQSALVLSRIAEHQPGQVKVRDEVWRAAPASGATGPFEAGSVVVVDDVEGVTLLVRSRA